MKVIVIGAGLGGLAVSCLLAEKGCEVVVLEKNEQPGGKINQLRVDEYRFDTGPSLLTMPFVLEKLFQTCGRSVSDYLEIIPLDPICRYFYKDGTRFDSYHSLEQNLAQLDNIAPYDREAFLNFLDYSKRLYHRTKDAFLFNPLYNISDLDSVKPWDLLRIDAFTSVADRVDSYFESPYMQQFFKRFTTYNGSSPYQAPATLNVIPHVELTLGGYYVKGGMFQIISALVKMAKEKGVKINYNTEVNTIDVLGGKATGVTTSYGNHISADLIVSNSDVTHTYTRILSEQAIKEYKRRNFNLIEPSCSAFVLLLGIQQSYEQLLHHNIFFSADYKKEFNQIFLQGVMPDDPTIYIANTSFSEPDHASEHGSNLFVLVNAPYLNQAWKWEKQKNAYQNLVIDELENRGLENIRENIRVSRVITPVDFQNKYHSYRGSIYGTSSNSRLAAFMRPRNKSREVHGLYMVGGSTHPGGGIPLVTLSAFHAADLIERFHG